MTTTYPAARLVQFAQDLMTGATMPADKASVVAAILVEGDLMGHTTHGLAQLPNYLAQIESGAMTVQGGPDVIADAPAALTWDGRRLPGPWLVMQALEAASERAARCGTGTVVIRRSHHIASLASYHARAAEQGVMLLLACSDPSGASVAPHGGLDAVFTPNPIAAVIPTPGDPIVMDISTSSTTNGLTGRLHKEGGRLPAPWLIDGHGVQTDDPAVLFKEPRGTILPLGGLDSGHKGYGLSLLVEALTGGLAGHGRADPREGWGSTVFVQIIDPAAFAGREAFLRQTDKLSQLCRASRPAVEGRPVRLPGERGFALSREQQGKGLSLHAGILPALKPWADKLGVGMP